MKIANCLFSSLILVALVGCNSNPKESEALESARVEYSKASQNIDLVKHAPEVLDAARAALNKADMHWKRNDQMLKVEHYAYLVGQRIETARLIAQGENTEQEIQAIVLRRNALNQRLRDAELVSVLKQASELKRKVSALSAEKTDRGMMWTLGDVLFDVDEATLAPMAARNIAQIASFMRNNPERQAVIEGHTDASGDADYNMKLSNERAVAVRDALVDTNIDASRLTVNSYGEMRPVAKNTSMFGKQANRRVEIIFPDEKLQVTEFDEH